MIRTLVTIPPHVNAFLRSPGGHGVWRAGEGLLAASDPPGRKLGSGGGTVGLIHTAWRETRARKQDLWEWVAAQPSLVLHAGGESRRLPAYAAIGKTMLPVPPLGHGSPRRFDQTLADFQLPAYAQVLREAGPHAAVMVASGDVWLELNALQIPNVSTDIAGIGMRVTPEVARHFGVFFVAKAAPAREAGAEPIAFFLQKPSANEIYRHLSKYDFYVDTGLWLLSAAAIRLLFRRCGWNDRRQIFATADGHPAFFDLYTELGRALGTRARPPATLLRLGWAQLTASVIPLDDARFFHLGSSRQLYESFDQLLRSNLSAPKTLSSATDPANIVHLSNFPVWLDGVSADRSLQLEGFNVVTSKPRATAALHLRQEQCLEIAPVGSNRYVFRPYALDDRLRGKTGHGGTICGQDAAEWLARRGFSRQSGDVFQLAVYPVVRDVDATQELLEWFFADRPDTEISARVQKWRRLSAAEIPGTVNLARYFAERTRNQAGALLAEFEACLKNGDTRVFAQDFAAIASCCRQKSPLLRTWLLNNYRTLLNRLARPEHQSRLLVLVAQLSRGSSRDAFNRQAYERLQAAIVSATQLTPSRPKLTLKEDQIVWSRSPVRLDLAGGWTDTPPYCFEYGGAVINVAVLLNGQPPIQVFVRPLPEPIISLRSIDLGSTEIITSDSALSSYRDPRSSFSLPKAALALAGFQREFSSGKSHLNLRSRLNAFGGGLEISLLSAVPKGSGLGTSSILSATLLGALNRACGLGWDEISLYNRVLALEQLLTTGGGWQDQAGALFRGVKLIQTAPGLSQAPSVRYLPSHLLDSSQANQTLLLYYTGITRLAKGILKEIVENMFLGRFETLQTLNLIKANAFQLFGALQQGGSTALHRCIARSWDLNKRLDPGTTTPEIEKIITICGPDLAATKLLGAGGGGYMLLCASSAAAGRRIRGRLEAQPPNRRARFIDFQTSERGLEVTVS